MINSSSIRIFLTSIHVTARIRIIWWTDMVSCSCGNTEILQTAPSLLLLLILKLLQCRCTKLLYMTKMSIITSRITVAMYMFISHWGRERGQERENARAKITVKFCKLFSCWSCNQQFPNQWRTFQTIQKRNNLTEILHTACCELELFSCIVMIKECTELGPKYILCS